MFQSAKNSIFVAAASMVSTASANGYTGSFSLKPEEECQGICMCMGDQDMSGLVDGGNGATGTILCVLWKR